MRKILLGVVLTFTAITGWAQNQDGTAMSYDYYIDLNKVKEDRLAVSLNIKGFKGDTAVFHLPKIVPGTYEIYDFGRFVHDLVAIDVSGADLRVLHPDVNTWVIPNANRLATLQYVVDDTWDTESEGPEIFEPAGTSFEKDKNYVINMHTMFGYLEGYKQAPFRIHITHPEGFYGSTGLEDIKPNGNSDVITAVSYMELVDSPIMYNEPDTVNLKIGATDVLVSVYSPEKLISAKTVGKEIRSILEAQKNYLGGKLPVDKYAFIIYLFGGMGGSGGVGALEHSYSSFYYLPEMPGKQLTSLISETAAHEFFHIVTPLTIHSEEIHNFDYMQDNMSEHLWLYEGVVEYFAHHVLVTNGLISKEDYLVTLEGQMTQAAKYRSDISFTQLSKGCTHEFKDEYMNVYQKGALIGMALDIELLKLSEGKYGIRDLIKDLSARYGKDRAFKDDSLFTVIASLTYPEISDFLHKYVDGTEALPYKSILAEVGIDYNDSKRTEEFGLGGVGLGMNPASGRLVVASLDEVNDFGRVMGYEIGDEIISVNKDEVTLDNVYEVLAKIKYGTSTGDKITVKVERKVNGEPKVVKLKAKAFAVPGEPRAELSLKENPSEEAQKLQNIWLGGE